MSSPQEQFAAAVRRSQAAAAEVAQAWTSITQSAAGSMPGAGSWDSDEMIDRLFDFAARMLADQRDLTKKLVHLSGQLADSAKAEAGAAAGTVSGGVKDRAGTATEAARTQAESALGSLASRADEARRAAQGATEMMLQTARSGAESMLEAAKDQIPFVGSGADTTAAIDKSAAPAAPPTSEIAQQEPAESPKRRAPRRATAKSTESTAAERTAKPRRRKAAAPSGPDPYEGMGKAALQEQLVARSLPKSGTIAELRARLAAADAS